MKQRNGNVLWWMGIGIWTLINLLQAGLTELDPDEAYYWMYSHALDWGYFDHPPAVAVLIRFGTALFTGELGVRLMTVLLLVLTARLIWKLAGSPGQPKQVGLLLLMLVAMPMFQVYGFIATPDAPLLFTTALFFLFYKKFLERTNWITALGMGLGMALLLYSKYHGLLVIGFTVLSNFKLWKKAWFYVAGLFGVLLFTPHLWWQYQHDFPSFRYHLVGRDDPYELKHTLNYIVNQLLIFNPFLLPLILSMLWKYPIKDKLERAFYFIIIGFVGFFFLSTFKGHAEPQWNAVLSIPLVVMLYRYGQDKPVFQKWIRYIGFASIGLFLLARTLLIYEFFDIKSHFHNRTWVHELEETADDAPVIFQNSYREASKFNFYSDVDAYTFTDIAYRQNQYDLWDWEKQWHDQRVLIVGQPDWECSNCQPRELTGLNKMLKFADSLQVTQKVRVDFQNDNGQWQAGQIKNFLLDIQNPYEHKVNFHAGNMPPSLIALLLDNSGEEVIIPLQFAPPLDILPAAGKQKINAQFVIPDTLRGSYRFGFGIQTGDLLPRLCSPVIDIQVQSINKDQ